MRQKIFFAVKATIFLFFLLIVVSRVNRILILKRGYDNAVNPTTTNYYGFYQMEPNTIDVLFVGSSHAASGFNPQDLYEDYGITGYNLGSNRQPVWLSYFWLKEALNYQSPKVVVLDCYYLFLDGKDNEAATRIALDDMRWGRVKKEAVDVVCKYDESQSQLSYILTNIRFHERWKELSETDYLWGKIYRSAELKGFWLYMGIYGNTEDYIEYMPFEIKDSKKDLFQPEEEEYLNEILKLCRQNNIELILVKTPTFAQTMERHNAIAYFADCNQIKFYDFNVKEIYEKIGFDYANDMNDSINNGDANAHANPSGARKMTRYIGEVLANEYGIEGRIDWQWENSKEFNDNHWKEFISQFDD